MRNKEVKLHLLRKEVGVSWDLTPAATRSLSSQNRCCFAWMCHLGRQWKGYVGRHDRGRRMLSKTLRKRRLMPGNWTNLGWKRRQAERCRWCQWFRPNSAFSASTGLQAFTLQNIFKMEWWVAGNWFQDVLFQRETVSAWNIWHLCRFCSFKSAFPRCGKSWFHILCEPESSKKWGQTRVRCKLIWTKRVRVCIVQRRPTFTWGLCAPVSTSLWNRRTHTVAKLGSSTGV